MKKGFRILGVILLVCGILVFALANALSESLEPNEISFGVVINGQYIETDKGQIGGNPDGQEELGLLSGIGIMFAVSGGVLLVASYVTKEENKYDY